MNLDLVVLAADKSIEEALRGLLGRHEAIGIRPIRYELIRHPERDPGCFHNPEDYLAPYAHDCRHALVVLDHAWDGVPTGGATRVAAQIEDRLRPTWGDRDRDRARALVIDPELEVWVWSDSPEVDRILEWAGQEPPLRNWLKQRSLWTEEREKPTDPKAAYEAAIRQVRLQKSSSNFRSLAENVGLGRCRDASFQRLLEILRSWFPRE